MSGYGWCIKLILATMLHEQKQPFNYILHCNVMYMYMYMYMYVYMYVCSKTRLPCTSFSLPLVEAA